MIQLNKNQYELLLKPLKQVDFNTYFIRSVIAGHADGKIFVDSLTNPESFYAICGYGMSLLFGETDNEQFNNELFNYFTQKTGIREKDEWLQAYPRDWDSLLEKVINVGKAKRNSRLNFSFSKAEFEKNNSQLPLNNYKIVPTTANMFSAANGTVIPSAFWRDNQQFLEVATSFTVTVDGDPASTAFASYRHDEMLEIGIETVEKHRGKGLARIACIRLINYCLENDLEPMWSCRLENTGSRILAEKLGFKETLCTPYYHIPV